MTAPPPDITAISVVRHGVPAANVRPRPDRRGRCARQDVGAVFEEARTPEGFLKVAVDEETGTVVWSGDADLAPDTLYERVRTGIWPDEDVAA